MQQQNNHLPIKNCIHTEFIVCKEKKNSVVRSNVNYVCVCVYCLSGSVFLCAYMHYTTDFAPLQEMGKICVTFCVCIQSVIGYIPHTSEPTTKFVYLFLVVVVFITTAGVTFCSDDSASRSFQIHTIFLLR